MKYVKVSEFPSYDHNESSSKEFDYDGSLYYSDRQIGEIPKFTATIFCSRKPGYYIFNAFFLIFLITSSALTIFAINCKLTPNRLQISYTLLLTSISFKWVINR